MMLKPKLRMPQEIFRAKVQKEPTIELLEQSFEATRLLKPTEAMPQEISS